MVGQIAKVKGTRVVAVAGSDAKCAVLTGERFDAALNYLDGGFRAALKAATPDGIDLYFDNTGGDILAAALRRMKVHGRIVCCGVRNPRRAYRRLSGPDDLIREHRSAGGHLW